MAATLILLLCVTIVFWSVKVFYGIWWRPKIIERQLRKQGIHGPPYRLLYGNTKEMMTAAMEARSKPMKLTHDIIPQLDPFLQKMAITYDKPFVVWYGTTPRVTIMDPKIVKEILSRKFEFQKPKINPWMKWFLTGLANHDGDKWVKHRKIINPAFHIEKLKRMLPSFLVCCEEMVERWDNFVGSNSIDSLELNVLPEFQNLTGEVISRAAFGSNLEEGRLIFSLQKEQGQLFLQSLRHSDFPWPGFLPSKLHKRMKEIHKQVGDLVGGLIEMREKAMESGNSENDDLLNLLLKSNLNELQEKRDSNNVGMTREDVIEECKLFYFAGHETTANLLTWTMVVLSMHLNWQDKARNEVLQIVGSNKPNFDDLSRFKIVNMILLEVLRLYPPTSLVRCTNKETKVGDLCLPAGVVLQIPLHLLQRDPQLWGEDATEFNPERCSGGIWKASMDQNSFFSFGWGPRTCIGQNFAMLEAKLAIALILQHFSFELSPTYKHAPNIHLTLQPHFGAQIILRRISSSHFSHQ